MEEQNLLPAEQKGCHPGSKGCKDQLVISKAIHEDCKRRNTNLSIAYIDYQKAFDNVPHSWVGNSIELVEANSEIVRFCKLSVDKCNTRLHLKTKQEVIQSQPIQIQRGIFQGLSFAITLLYSTYSINKGAEQS